MQIPIPALSKDSVRGLHGIPAAVALLSRVFDHGGFRSITYDIISNRDTTGRIAKWAIELLPFEITYKPRRAIKSQVLAGFVAEWTEAELPKEYDTYSNWVMHFDGSKMLAGLWAGVVLTSPTGDAVQYVPQILFTDSNNAAEYEALLHGLQMAVSMGIQRLEVRGDSNLAISQINGDFDAKVSHP